MDYQWKSCGLCVEDQQCEALEPEEGWECTRELNHPGDHVACGFVDHQIKRWSASPEENSTVLTKEQILEMLGEGPNEG